MIALSGQPSAFSYNGLGNRLQQTINGQSTRYALDINTSLPNVLSDGSRTYTYGLGNLSQSNGTATDYFLGDALGSTRQLADATGQIGLAESYEPFGNPTTTSGAGSSIFGYAGQQTDISGLQFLRARYYQPMQGRFLNRDSFAGYVDLPQSLNRYVYGLNNPVRYTDPSGNSPFPFFGLNTIAADISLALHGSDAAGSPCALTDQLLMVIGAGGLAAVLNAWTMLSTWNPGPDLRYFAYFLAAAGYQYTNDMTFGLYPTLLLGLNLDYYDNYPFQRGRQVGHNFAMEVATIGTVVGTFELGYGLAAAAATFFGGLGGAPETGGATALVAGVAIPVELIVAVEGAAVAGYGHQVLALRSEITGRGTTSPSSHINITKKGLQHVIDEHMPGGSQTSRKSVFNEQENIVQLIQSAENAPLEPSYGGRFVRKVDAGHIIGVTRDGVATSEYTVVTDFSGNLVTAYPGRP